MPSNEVLRYDFQFDVKKGLKNDDTINDVFTHLQVYIAEVECDVSVATSRNIHGWSEASIKELNTEWDCTPEHFNKLDLRGFLQDKEITQVEMEDAANDDESAATLEVGKKDTTNKDDNDEDEVSFLDEQKSNYAVIIE